MSGYPLCKSCKKERLKETYFKSIDVGPKPYEIVKYHVYLKCPNCGRSFETRYTRIKGQRLPRRKFLPLY